MRALSDGGVEFSQQDWQQMTGAISTLQSAIADLTKSSIVDRNSYATLLTERNALALKLSDGASWLTAFNQAPPSPPPAPVPVPTPTGWTRRTNFSSMAIGSKAQGPAGFDEAFAQTVISDEPGTVVARLGIDAGSDGWGTWGGIINYPQNLVEGDELWFRVRTFFPTTFSPVAQPRLKFLRARTAQGYLDLYILPGGGFAFNNEITGFSTAENYQTGLPTPFGEPIQQGVWETYEVYIKFSSGPTGIYRAWKNGVLMYENLAQKTLSSSASVSTGAYLFTYWNSFNNVGSPKTQTMFVDDVVMTSSTPIARDANNNPMLGVG